MALAEDLSVLETFYPSPEFLSPARSETAKASCSDPKILIRFSRLSLINPQISNSPVAKESSEFFLFNKKSFIYPKLQPLQQQRTGCAVHKHQEGRKGLL